MEELGPKRDTIVTSIVKVLLFSLTLQLAVMISRIASGGKNIMPKIIKQNQRLMKIMI